MWNKQVLENEACHRELHEQGQCACGYDFTVAERERSAAAKREMEKGKEIAQAKGWGNGTRKETYQPMNSPQETSWQEDSRKKDSYQRSSPPYVNQGYHSRGRPRAHRPPHWDPNYRPFVGSGTYIRYHLQGEQYTGTLHNNGTVTIAVDVPTPEGQQAESNLFVNVGSTEEAGFTDKSSTKDLSVPEELSQGDQVSSVTEEIPPNTVYNPTSPIPISRGVNLPMRTRSSSI